MGKNSKQKKKNKNSKKSQKNQTQNQPKAQQNHHPQNSKPAPSPKFQPKEEYALLEQKFPINHASSKKRDRNKRRQTFENISEPIPNKGLTNLGNSCFANALFQCLYHVTAFRNSVIESKDTSGPLLSN